MTLKNGTDAERPRPGVLKPVVRNFYAGLVVLAAILPSYAAAASDPCIQALEGHREVVASMGADTATGAVYVSPGHPLRVVKVGEAGTEPLPIVVISRNDDDLASPLSLGDHRYVTSGAQSWSPGPTRAQAWKGCPRLFYAMAQPQRPYLAGHLNADMVKNDAVLAGWLRPSPSPEASGLPGAHRVRHRFDQEPSADISKLDQLGLEVLKQLGCSDPDSMPRTCAVVKTISLSGIRKEQTTLRRAVIADAIDRVGSTGSNPCFAGSIDIGTIGSMISRDDPHTRWLFAIELMERTGTRWNAGNATTQLAARVVDACHVAQSRQELAGGIESCPAGLVAGKLMTSLGVSGLNAADATALAALYLQVEASLGVSTERAWRSALQLWLRDGEIACRATAMRDVLRRLIAAELDANTSNALVIAAELAGEKVLKGVDPNAFRTLSFAIERDATALARLIPGRPQRASARWEIGVSPRVVIGARFVGEPQLHAPVALLAGARLAGSSWFVSLDPIDLGHFLTTDNDPSGDLGIREPRALDFLAPTLSAGLTFGKCESLNLGLFVGTSRIVYDDQKVVAGLGLGTFLPLFEVGHE
jgi:hypothetical protein